MSDIINPETLPADSLLLDRAGRRSIMRTLKNALDRGLHVGDNGLKKAVMMAEAALDDPECSYREKLTAGALLNSIVSKGVDVAMLAVKAEGETANNGNKDNRVVVVVNNVNRLPDRDTGESSGAARGPVVGDSERPTLQRFDVRKTIGEDNNG